MPRADDRRVISGIVHVPKSGCRRVDAATAYGPCKTLYNGSNWPIIEEMIAFGRYAFDVSEASTARLSARG